MQSGIALQAHQVQHRPNQAANGLLLTWLAAFASQKRQLPIAWRAVLVACAVALAKVGHLLR